MIIVLGSSRPGEETLILNSFDYLKPKFPELKLIIAIRHMDRMADVNNLLAGRDVSYFTKAEPAKDIHIIDELGHLLPAYAICDIAIVGGSFYPFGGHNPLEAAFYSKVIIMGNHHESCLGSVKKLLKANAMIISDTDKLTSDLELVLSNPQKYIVYGERAKQVLLTNSESLPLHLKIIEGLL
jgi:3-deoxy-D-manno-octulosonic-acid transferase